MRDIRFVASAMTKAYVELEAREAVRTTAVPKKQPELTMFEKIGAPSNLNEWAEWYHEHRKNRGIPECGLLPAVALDLRRRNSVIVCTDDRQAPEKPLTDEELELF